MAMIESGEAGARKPAIHQLENETTRHPTKITDKNNNGFIITYGK